MEENDWRPSAPPSLDNFHEIELDTETNGLKWYAGHRPVGIAIRTPDGKCQYLPWGHVGSQNLDEKIVKRWAQRELRGKHITFANAKFDIHMMRVWGIDLEEQGNSVADVMSNAALLDDNRRQFNLNLLAYENLGMQKLDLDMSNGAHIFPAGHVAAYACQDVNLTGLIKEKQMPELREQDLMRVWKLENDIIFAVAEMEKNASKLDTEKLGLWVSKSEDEVELLKWQIQKESGVRCDIAKREDLMRLFYHLNIANPYTTKTGAMSFDDAVLSEFKEHPVINKLRRAKKLMSLRAKFLCTYQDLVDPNGILRYFLHPLRADDGGTISGRFSSSGGDDGVNIQQVSSPDRQKKFWGDDYVIRELYIPCDPTWFWLCADASQIEFRLFGHYSESPTIIEAYKKDPMTDFHQAVTDMIKLFLPEITRARAKDVNFARIYAAGLEKIALMLGLSIKETKALLSIYDSAFPEAKKLVRKASDLAEERGYVRTLLGRRARFTSTRKIHAALNRVIQGTAADIAKQKIKELHDERKYTQFIMRFVVHDEFDGDIPNQECANRVHEILDRQSFDLKVPILWKVGIGKNWAEAK